MFVEKPDKDLRVMIVSSCDNNYYPLLLELISSLEKYLDKPCDRFDYSFGFVDAGINAEDLESLENRGVITKELANYVYFSPLILRGRKYLLSTFVRAYLPEYFPGYDVYVWMDADSWICNKEVIELYVEGALKGNLAIVSGADRSSEQITVVARWFGSWARIKNFYMKNARGAGLTWKESQHLALKPTLFSGNFALHANAPHWASYKNNIERVIQRGRIFGSDQLALGMTVYLDKLPAELLPAWCNWTRTPMFDEEKNKFVEPYLPHHPIGIMHLSGRDAMRADRSVKAPIKTIKGNVIDLSLRYSSHK